MKQMGLSGEQPLGEAKTKAPNFDYHKDEPPVAARQAEVARDYEGADTSAEDQTLRNSTSHLIRGLSP